MESHRKGVVAEFGITVTVMVRLLVEELVPKIPVLEKPERSALERSVLERSVLERSGLER